MTAQQLDQTNGTDDVEQPTVARKSDLSPYAAHLLVNAIAHRKTPDAKDVRPQMFYGYAKRGVILSYCAASLAGEGSDHKTHAKCEDVLFDGEEFYAWLKRYFAGERTARTQVDVDALSAQFEIE